MKPIVASEEQLKKFHNKQYIEAIKLLGKNDKNENDSSSSSSDSEDDEENLLFLAKQHGLVDDAAVFKGLYDYCCSVAGGTITAAQALIKGYKCSIHWDGGRHHAGKENAAGYCYVNDIVLGILELMKKYNKIMCIDIDVHHG